MIATAMERLQAKPPKVREVLKRYMLHNRAAHDSDLEACADAALAWWEEFWSGVGAGAVDSEEDWAARGLAYLERRQRERRPQ
jgi:hypothetical protein